MGGTEGWILPVRITMPVVLYNKKTINDQKETEKKWQNKIKCNRNTEPFNNIYFLIKDTKIVIRRGKLNDKQCNNQKETEQKDF